MSDQWGVHLFSLRGGGVLAESTCLTFEGTRLWFQRKGANVPESGPVAWIGGEFSMQVTGLLVTGCLKTKEMTGLDHEVLLGSAVMSPGTKGEDGTITDDIDSFIAMRVGGWIRST